jgi:hypothetical protein
MPKIPDKLKSAIGVTARWALNLLAGMILGKLVAHNVLTPDQTKIILSSPEWLFIVGSAVIGAPTLVWGLFVKVKAWYKLKMALNAEAGTSMAQIKKSVDQAKVTTVIKEGLTLQ